MSEAIHKEILEYGAQGFLVKEMQDGIWLQLGNAGNLCCINIKENIDTSAIPFSPCVIAGATEMRIFRINEMPAQGADRENIEREAIDIIFSGQIPLPPSNGTEWGEMDLKLVGKEGLPVLSIHDIKALTGANMASNMPKKPRIEEESQKFTAISDLANKLIEAKIPVETAVSRLLAFDDQNFTANSFFLDAKRCQTNNKTVNAFHFYGNMLAIANKVKSVHVPPLKVSANAPVSAWGEIKGSTRVLPELPLDLVPEKIRQITVQASEATGVPRQMFLFSILGNLSACFGNKRQCQPYQNNQGYLESANLYVMLVAQSGQRKTQVSKISKGPLLKLNQTLRETSKERQRQVKITNERIKREVERLQQDLRDMEDPEDIAKIEKEIEEKIKSKKDFKSLSIYEQEATVEKLYNIAEANSHGLAIEGTEWGAMFKRLKRREMQGHRNFLMNGWDGNGTFSYKTKHQGEVYIEQLCLSYLAGCQNSVLYDILTGLMNGEDDDGLMQRFLLVASAPFTPSFEDLHFQIPESFNELFRDAYYRDARAEHYLFSDAATEAWQAYQEELHTRIVKEIPALSSYLSKQIGSVVRIASLLGQMNREETVSLETYQNAEGLINWIEESTRYCFDMGNAKEDEAIINQMREGGIEDETTMRAFARDYAPRDRAKANNLITRLEKRNIVRCFKDGKSTKIKINPNL